MPMEWKDLKEINRIYVKNIHNVYPNLYVKKKV